MDGSEGEDNVKMIRTTYDELREDGFTLRRIIVTHPDKDHYRGIGDVLEFTGVNTPPVLLTNQFKCKLKNKKKEPADPTQKEQADPAQKEPANKLKKFCDTITETFGYSEFSVDNIEYIENKALSTPFKVEYKSSTSDLVLYKTDNETVEKPGKEKGEFCKPKQDRYNESSIVTTITLKDNSKILACLTGDAFFDSADQITTFLLDREITVFQVPHHGSKHNSNFEFYVQIAGNTQYYLISCGHHGSYDFPHKEVFTAIRKATVAKEKKGATIVLTDGTHLNGERMSSFRGGDYEPSVSYWDPHLKKDSNCELINKDFLQFTFSGEGNLVDNPLQNLIQWSIEGYRQMTFNYGSKQRLCGMHLKTSNNHHLKVVNKALITEKCQSDGCCTASIDGHIGLPAPTDPCTWDNRVIMVYGTEDLIFLQLATGERIIKVQTYHDAQADLKKSYISIRKLTMRKADGYGEVVSHLIGALTDVIFEMKTTAAKKVEMINAVKIALKDPKKIDEIGKFGDSKEAIDSIMRLVEIAYQVQADLNESKKYDQKICDQRILEIDTIKKGLSLSEPTSITSLDEEFVVFKCVDVPWQIAYGTINDNGEVNWGVLNTLKTSTDTIPMTVFKPKHLS